MSRIDKLKRTYLKEEFILGLDLFLSLLSSVIVILGVKLIFADSFYSPHWLLLYLVCSLGGTLLMFVLTSTFKIIIRHLTVKDLISFVLAALGKGMLVIGAMSLLGYYSKWLLLITIVDFLITFLALICVRLAMILVYSVINSKSREKYEHQRVLVYGTSSKSVAAMVRLQNSSHYKVLGFIDRSDKKTNYLLDQLPVNHFADDKKLSSILLNNSIDAVLFSKDTDAQAEENGLIKYCSVHNIKTLIIPNVDEVVEGQMLLRPREIKVEDLLGRKEIKISLDEIQASIKDKVVMVTGAAGSIGSELVRQLASFGVKKLILFDNAETPMHYFRLELEDRFPNQDFIPVIGDLRQVSRVDFAFRNYRPQVVFHAAAYKHVPLMEENPCEAIMVNTWGTRNVADRCVEYDVEKMVMISTDKAVNPTNIMGCTKRLAEIYVQSLGLAIERGDKEGKTKFVTTRFGNVLGSNGSVIPRFSEQISKGGPVTVTHPDITRFFMTIPEACRLVMEAATMGTSNQIFVFDMGEPVKIDQLARRMITLAGYVPDKDIKIEYSGLRPGEKLYEEVLSNKENTLPTFHERIRIAKVREYVYKDIVPVFSELHHLAEKVQIEEMVRLMKKTVPEYKSANSKYSEFDKQQ